MNIRKWIVAVLSVVAVGFAGLSIATDEAPSGTVNIHEKQFGFILNGDWGHGSLIVDGEKHMFHMSGAKIGGLGFSSMTVEGKVYHLNKLEDFEGVYFKAEAGLTIAKGKTGAWLKNTKGVVMHLGAKTEGLALQLGAEGLKVSF